MSNRRIRTSAVVQERAKSLRQEMTAAEKELWRHLKAKRLAGFKWRRQHPLGRIITDFCCPACRLVVEVDGDIHRSRKEEDAGRTGQLEAHGYQVLRFANEQVLTQLDVVLGEIERACHRRAERNPRCAGNEDVDQ